MMQPLVSVIIPCYNSEAYIAQAIQSVINQTYKNLEIIVVDDGSTDRSPDIVTSFSSKIIYIRQNNCGVSAARNSGLKIASGKYIKFLDADDILISNIIEEQVKQTSTLKANEKAIVYGYLAKINQKGDKYFIPRFKILHPNDDQLAYLIENNFIITACPLHKRDYLLEINGFDETLSNGEEPELHIRLVLNGIRFVYFPSLVYYYRQHKSPDRISTQIWYIEDPFFGLQFLDKYENLIKNKIGYLSHSVRLSLADRHSAFARNLLKIKRFDIAKRHFDASQRLNPKGRIRINKSYNAARIYFLLSQFLGQYLTERIYSLFISLLKLMLKKERF